MGQILVLAGVNGAGKSSLLGSILREHDVPWFNPDTYTRQLVEAGWEASEANSIAWNEGRQRLEEAIETGRNHAFETTLGGDTIKQLLMQASATQQVVMWYCGLEGVDLHIERVAARVAAGGHDILRERILARYQSSRANLVQLIPHLTCLRVFDNSAPAQDEAELQLVLEMNEGELLHPCTPDQLRLTPQWAQPIVMGALNYVDQ